MTLAEKVDGVDHKEYILQVIKCILVHSSDEIVSKYEITQALSSHQKATDILQTCCDKVVSLCHSVENMRLPVRVELVASQLNSAQTLLCIYKEFSTEQRRGRVVEQQKSSIQKVLLNGKCVHTDSFGSSILKASSLPELFTQCYELPSLL